MKRRSWLDRLYVELVVAAFGALLIDFYTRLSALERRGDIALIPTPIPRDRREKQEKEDKEEGVK
jgi:hypothetical protein